MSQKNPNTLGKLSDISVSENNEWWMKCWYKTF